MSRLYLSPLAARAFAFDIPPVMAGLVPAIYVLATERETWMPGTSPGMTSLWAQSSRATHSEAWLERSFQTAAHSRIPRREERPGYAQIFAPKTEGVGNAGCRFAPAASRAEKIEHTS